ncbi:MAG: DUF5700 domain-containing putative Zn-dependent protease [Candidatus Heimdallarchaeaceae archaeon]
MDEHKIEFNDSFNEVMNYLPEQYKLKTKLFCTIGYDIWIAYEGHASLNIGDSIFHRNLNELIFFAMHEIHHVGFFHFNPISFSFGTLKKISDLIKIIKYLTHLEGIATYTPFSLRKKYNDLSFFDYQILIDKEKRTKFTKEYFKIMDDLLKRKDEEVKEKDMKILEIMSGQKKRLWYIAGCHMAEEIDKNLGRKALVSTINTGKSSFFETYNSI